MNNRRNYAGALTFAMFLILVPAIYPQATIHVPTDQSTIQAAIDASQNGDTVLVAPGTYTENINFHGKAITLTSASGPQSTIIDGGAKDTVVTFNTREGPQSILNGFTVQNGTSGSYGAGIEITHCSPTITGNIITNNHGLAGVGIDVDGGSPLIKNNTITANAQTMGSGGGGGAIQASGNQQFPASPMIINNTITNNSLAAGGNGGGIYAIYFGRPVIQNNLIQGNSAYNYGGGISIWTYDGAVINQNLIINNSTGGGGDGGGVDIESQTVVVTNNTIVNNSSHVGTSGIYVASQSAQTNTIANNIVVAIPYQGAVSCTPGWTAPSPVFSHNDFFVSNGTISGGNCDLSNGTISVDPLFVNAVNDFHLQPSSLAIDAGDNSVLGLPSQDRDGRPRIIDGNNDCFSTIDLGAYELQAAVQGILAPTSITFPSQQVGTTGAASPVILSSTGTTCFQITSIDMSPDFLQTNNCGNGVPAGNTCTISVSFHPLLAGSRTGQLSVTGNAAPNQVSLSGTGVVPRATVTPTVLNFLGQVLNTTSSSQGITVTNTGDVTLHISAISVTGDFVQTGVSCVGSLVPASNCVINIAFKPIAFGSRAGTLTIASDSSPAAPSVSLTGTGVAAAPILSPSSVSFGNVTVGGKAASQTVQLKAVAPGPLSISSISVTTGFSQTNKCPATLNAGSSCSITISFKPTVAGTVSGSLMVVDNGLGSPHPVPVSGTGVKKR